MSISTTNTTFPLTVKLIGKEWNDRMLSILRASPIQSGGFHICFDRSPDIFAIPEFKSKYYRCAGLFKDQLLVGFGFLTFHDVYVNKKEEITAYLSNVFVLKQFRGNDFVLRAFDCFFQERFESVRIGYAIVMKGNKPVEKLVGRSKSQYLRVPYSKILQQIVVKNILITFAKRKRLQYNVRLATMNDVDSIVDLLKNEFQKQLFAPIISKKKFLRNLNIRPDFGISNYYIAENNNEIIGVCAAWDTTIFRKTRILKYNFLAKIISNIYSVGIVAFGFPSLPQKGAFFKEISITDCAVKERNPKILKAILRKVYNDSRGKGYNLIIFGSYEDDPLLKATNNFFRYSITSNIIISSFDKNLINKGIIDARMPYIDISTL